MRARSLSSLVLAARRRVRTSLPGAPSTASFRQPYYDNLRGDGLEIGPLHHPAPLPAEARVRYVDQLDREALSGLYPDVPLETIVTPDVIADGHNLSPVSDDSIDFVVASHVIEHMHDPIRGLLEWRRVLHTGALLVLIVPDGRFTFDAGRPLTPFEHLLWDYVNEGTRLKTLSDLFHIAECNLNLHDTLDVDSSVSLAQTILAQTYDTHFHVWSFETFTLHLRRLIDEFGLPYAIAASGSDGRSEMAFQLEATNSRFQLADGAIPQAGR
jgi:SAM-dependent methyltransferase